MKIESLSVKNVTSYQNLTTFHFDSRLNILIGPNGGGKSNAQRILTVLLTKYFLPQYVFRVDGSRPGISIADKWETEKITQLLDRYIGDSSDQEITVTLKVEDSDIENMRAIAGNVDEIGRQASNKWHYTSISCLTEDEINAVASAGRFEYQFRNNVPVSVKNVPAQHYLKYLQSFFMIARLADRIESMSLRSPIFFFSSARQSDTNFSAATTEFAEEQYYQQYQSVYSAATGGATNLIQFSTRHFGRLMWRAISRSSESSQYATEFFEEESDVKLVRQHLEKLGYKWNLVPIDQDRMKYKMEFYKEGQLLEPTKFSSGEREIFHFLFAAFALNVEDGVIIIDEPELHLHPRWQRIFLDLFYDLSEQRKNQFILATHSPGFVTPRTITNITRIYQKDRVSKKASLADAHLPNKQHLVRIVNSHNNERLFFADEVVLVEGISDRLILSSLVQTYSRDLAINRTIEVVEVGGKHNFAGYKELCEGIQMPVSIVADRDYLRDVANEYVKGLFVVDYKKVWENLSKKKSEDRSVLCQALEKAINEQDFDDLRSFWDYLKTRGTTLKPDLNDEEKGRLASEAARLKGERMFILRQGEIEDYLPKGCSDVADIIELTRDPQWLRSKINKSRALELNEIMCGILTIDHQQESTLAKAINTHRS